MGDARGIPSRCRPPPPLADSRGLPGARGTSFASRALALDTLSHQLAVRLRALDLIGLQVAIAHLEQKPVSSEPARAQLPPGALLSRQASPARRSRRF